MQWLAPRTINSTAAMLGVEQGRGHYSAVLITPFDSSDSMGSSRLDPLLLDHSLVGVSHNEMYGDDSAAVGVEMAVQLALATPCKLEV